MGCFWAKKSVDLLEWKMSKYGLVMRKIEILMVLSVGGVEVDGHFHCFLRFFGVFS